ncbi:MAG TPA: helix-turn-helix domain-containing protein [Blastocatellia bacterium]|nr:helix-turn-helix domain-containing protein [Blastocatellia bacterium]
MAKMLTTGEVAKRLGAGISSVKLWANQGRFPGAVREQTPVGSYWMIPEAALKGFEMGKPGRPRKQPPSERMSAKKAGSRKPAGKTK